MNDIEFVQMLYEDTNKWIKLYSSGVDRLLRSELHHLDKYLTSIDINRVQELITLGVLIRTEELYANGLDRIYKCTLSKHLKQMISTIKEYGFLKLDVKALNMDFLGTSRFAVILSHSAKGMVDFTYNGASYTVNKSTDFKFFKTQHKLLQELKYERIKKRTD